LGEEIFPGRRQAIPQIAIGVKAFTFVSLVDDPGVWSTLGLVDVPSADSPLLAYAIPLLTPFMPFILLYFDGFKFR
jgi:hypothetical protein